MIRLLTQLRANISSHTLIPSLHFQKLSSPNSFNSQRFYPKYQFSSLEQRKKELKMSKALKEEQEKRKLKEKMDYRKSGQLYEGEKEEIQNLSDLPIQQTPKVFWRSLLFLQVPQLFYLYQASFSQYFSVSFANSAALVADSAAFATAVLGGMYFGYAILKKESYSVLLSPFTLACLVVSVHLAYSLNPLCFVPIYLAQLIQILADYQGSSSGRYPNFVLSAKSRFFILNFLITLIGFFCLQNFSNYQNQMKAMKIKYEERSKELFQQSQKNIKNQLDSNNKTQV